MPEPEQAFPLQERQPGTFGAALAGMVNRPVLASQGWQDQQSRAVRHGAHPDILLFERTFVRATAKLGIPMFAHETVRTEERQNDLYALGVSVAMGGQSAHQYGCATDVVHSVKFWSLTEKEWLLIGHVGKEVALARGLKMRWGGDWDGDGDIHDQKLFDPAHWELQDWKQQKDGFPWLTK